MHTKDTTNMETRVYRKVTATCAWHVILLTGFRFFTAFSFNIFDSNTMPKNCIAFASSNSTRIHQYIFHACTPPRPVAASLRPCYLLIHSGLFLYFCCVLFTIDNASIQLILFFPHLTSTCDFSHANYFHNRCRPAPKSWHGLFPSQRHLIS